MSQNDVDVRIKTYLDLAQCYVLASVQDAPVT